MHGIHGLAPNLALLVENRRLFLHLNAKLLAHPGGKRLGVVNGLGLHQKVLQIVVHVATPLVASLQILGQRLHNDLVERGRNLFVHRRGRRHIDVAHFFQRRKVALTKEQSLVGEDLVKDGADGKDVGLLIKRLAADLLGAHIAKLALEHTGLGLRRARRCFGDTKVDDLDLAFVADDDVLRRDVAMNDIQRLAGRVFFTMGIVEPFAHLARQKRRHIDRHKLAQPTEAILDLEHIFAPDVLHRDEVAVVDATELKDLANVGVIQLPTDLCLVDEHLNEVRVLGHGRQDLLDRNDLLETFDAEGFGLKDLGHSAHGDTFEEQIFSKWLR